MPAVWRNLSGAGTPQMRSSRSETSKTPTLKRGPSVVVCTSGAGERRGRGGGHGAAGHGGGVGTRRRPQ